jgi:transcriptional repressor NrdR
MNCPFCRVDNDRVIDSRAVQDGFAIRRRRECLNCKRRFSTYERVEELSLKVIKKNGAREPFDREKIRLGLERACWKRPISDEQIGTIVSAIESDVFERFESEVPSRDVGEMLLQRLAELDEVAFVRFASVYRDFNDVRDFVNALRPMLDAQKKRSGH